MDISVIIPSHNRAGSLPRALDSVLSQSLAALEIIVVDDGSDDSTEELIREHYSQIRYLHQTNQGVSNARNRGIQSSRGDWIALLDSDDAWKTDKLRRQKEALESNPGFQLCHTDEIWIRNGERVNSMHKHAKKGGWIFQHCLPLCAISPSSVIIHRSVFDSIGLFDESLPACEDYDLWLRTCSRYPVLFLKEQLVTKYGGHSDQLSRKYWGMDRFRVQALDNIIQSGPLQRADRTAAIRMLLQKTEILLQGAEKRGNMQLARHCEKMLARHQPPPESKVSTQP